MMQVDFSSPCPEHVRPAWQIFISYFTAAKQAIRTVIRPTYISHSSLFEQSNYMIIAVRILVENEQLDSRLRTALQLHVIFLVLHSSIISRGPIHWQVLCDDAKSGESEFPSWSAEETGPCKILKETRAV